MYRLVIKAEKNYQINFKELLYYKDLFFILAYRDFKVRYAQTMLGIVWAFIQPATTLLIFTVVFSRVVKVNTGNLPYPLFALSGMIAWTYFSFIMSQAGNSIINAQQMVKKVYFPRLIIPLSKAAVGFIDFIIALIFLVFIMIYYRFTPSANIVWLPLCTVALVVTALGVGIWLSALTTRYRDFQHIIPFVVQLGMYATPIAYPSTLVSEDYQLVYHFNPMAGIVELFQWSILGTQSVTTYSFISIFIGIILFLTSIVYFKKVERVMADLL